MKRRLSEHPDFPCLLKAIKEYIDTGEELVFSDYEMPEVVCLFALVPCLMAFSALLLPDPMVLTSVALLLVPVQWENWRRHRKVIKMFRTTVLFVRNRQAFRAESHQDGLVTAVDQAGERHVLHLRQCFLPDAADLLFWGQDLEKRNSPL